MASDYVALLKKMYPKGFEYLATQKFPLSKMLLAKGKGDWRGDTIDVPMVEGDGGTQSSSYSVSRGGGTVVTPSTKWILTSPRPTSFVTKQISAEDMRSSVGREASFIEAKRLEFDGAVKKLGRRLSFDIYGDGGGTTGGAITAVGTSSVTVTDKRTVTLYQKGDMVQFANARTAGSLRDSGDYLVVLDADPFTGVISFDTAGFNDGLTANIALLAAGDFVVVRGNYDASNSFKGLRKLFPLTAPSSGDSLYSVDRSGHSKLIGARLDNAGAPIESNIISLADDIFHTTGEAPDVCVLSPTNYQKAAASLGSKVQLIDQEMKAKWGFEAIELYCSGGKLMIVPDPACDVDLGYVLNMESLKLYSLDEVPHLVNDSGQEGQQSETVDAVTFMWRYWCTLVCNAPNRNGVFSIA